MSDASGLLETFYGRLSKFRNRKDWPRDAITDEAQLPIPGRSGSGRDTDWIRAYTSSIAVIVVILDFLLSTMR